MLFPTIRTCLNWVGILLLLIHFRLDAQPSSMAFERVPTQKWLYQRNITCVAQDAQGFMWFGTSNGLYRFDGYGVAEYRHEPHNPNSLSHNNVNALYVDSKGNLWIGTWGGLSKFDPRHGRFTRYIHNPRSPGSISNNDVRSITEDSQGNIWVGTFGGGLNKLLGNDRFVAYMYQKNNAGSINSNYINVLLRDKAGDVWVGTRQGLNKLDTETGRFISFTQFSDTLRTVQYNISSIFEGRGQWLWIGTQQSGLIRLDRRTGTQTQFFPKNKDNGLPRNSSVNDIAEEERGKLWIATSEGVIILDKVSGEVSLVQNNPNNASSLLNNDVRRLFKDRSGAMWIVTAEGINIYSRLGGRFRKFQRNPNDKNSLPNNIVNCFAEDPQGGIWLGTHEGLAYFQPGSRRFTQYPLRFSDENFAASTNITSILIDKKNRFWLGTPTGLNLYNPLTGKATPYRYDNLRINSLKNEIHSLYETRNGEIWVGLRRGIARFNPETGEYELFRPDPAVAENQITNSVYAMLEDRFGKFWVGTLGGGLSEFDRKTGKFITYRNIPGDSLSLSHNSVISLYEDRFGFFWVGTYGGGLNRFDRKGQFLSFTAQNGMPHDMIYNIQEDRKGNLWMSTNSGLVKLDTKTKTFRNYDALDGLQSNEFLIGSGLRTSKWEMLFGGIAGFNYFNPDSILENNYIPPTVITSFRVLDKPITLDTSVVTLNHNQNYIAFEFSSLSYALSDKNQFSYKLEGFDDDWIYCGSRRFVSYSNLGPGEYTFRVRSSNSDGLWNEKGTSITLKIARPFWKTWWFILLCLFSITGTLYLGYRMRVRAINKQTQLLELKVKRRTQELEKASREAVAAREAAEKASRSKSGFLANMSHEIRTPLNGILGFTDLLIRNNPNPEDQKYLELIRSSGDTLLKLLSDILDLNKIEQGKLTIESIRFNFVEVMQQTLIPYQYRANEKGLQFLLSFDSRIPTYITADPTRIKQLLINLISNSIKFTDQGGIMVSFEAETDPRGTDELFYIRGRVTDTGIGIPQEKQALVFESFTQADGSFTRRYGGSGLGLSIVKQLLRLMNGDVKLTSPAEERAFKSSTPGATFEFRFQVKAEKDLLQAPAKVNGHSPGLKFDHPYRVLLVEDNKINQLLAVTVLENLGMHVTTADDGEQGIQKIKEEKFDIVLMDVQMPVMNGYESTTAIREMGITIPVIGLTANVYKEDIEKCFEAGMNAHLGKPFTESDLYHELKKWLN